MHLSAVCACSSFLISQPTVGDEGTGVYSLNFPSFFSLSINERIGPIINIMMIMILFLPCFFKLRADELARGRLNDMCDGIYSNVVGDGAYDMPFFPLN